MIMGTKNKKFFSSIMVMAVISLTLIADGAQPKKKPVAKRPAAAARSAPASRGVIKNPVQSKADAQLAYALNLAKNGDYQGASTRLFNMTRNPQFLAQRMRIKYILGLMFYEMKMYQVAAFQFVDVVRNSDARYLKQSIQKLSLAADQLNDDTLLNYAIGKVNVDDFPKDNRDMLRFRIGEYEQRKEHWDLAADSFSKVPETSPYYPKAKYLEGLVHVKRNDLPAALRAYSSLTESRSTASVTDVDRISGILGMARVYYQAHKWDLAIDMYRQIPRDTDAWHDTLFESSWAHMRAAQFRSVLSNLHSLHSPYYEDFYLPESILLRGIVYLYICKYDEMEKTLGLFEKIYQPVQARLDEYTVQVADPVAYFNEIERVLRNFDVLKADAKARSTYRIPFLVARDIIREGDFKHNYQYILKLRNEDQLVNAMPAPWRRAPIGIYAHNLLKGRLDTSTKVAGNIVRSHMLRMKQELAEMFEQYNFGRYEMLNGRKEQLKKKIQGKGLLASHVDDSKNRDFYIQNGDE